MHDVHHLIHFDCPVETLYTAITTEAGIRSWWTPDVDLDAEVGGTGTFRFYGGDKVTRVSIEKLDAPRAVIWTVVDSFRPEWIGTTILFDLRARGAGAELHFSHRGYPRADEDFARCTTGWGIYLARLRKALDQQPNDEAAAIVAAFAAEVGDRNVPIALAVDFLVRQDADEAIAEQFALAATKTVDEPGAIAFRLHHTPRDPCRFFVYERWRSLKDLEVHLRQPHIVALRRHIDEVIVGQPEFRIFLPNWPRSRDG